MRKRNDKGKKEHFSLLGRTKQRSDESKTILTTFVISATYSASTNTTITTEFIVISFEKNVAKRIRRDPLRDLGTGIGQVGEVGAIT